MAAGLQICLCNIAVSLCAVRRVFKISSTQDSRLQLCHLTLLCDCVQIADVEAAFLKQLGTVATEAAQVKALMEAVVPKDVAKWQMIADIQQLRKEAQDMSRTLRQQKEVSTDCFPDSTQRC